MGVLFLKEDLQNNLKNQPESGMGFQLIHAVIKYQSYQPNEIYMSGLFGDDFLENDFLVLNGKYLLPFNIQNQTYNIKFLKPEDFWKNKQDLNEYKKIVVNEIKEIALLFNSFEPEKSKELSMNSFKFVSQELILKTITQDNEIFFRFCTEKQDLRVEKDSGNFLPGTYATTLSDIEIVPSGFAAVGRYALPNPRSARFVHVIIPPAGTAIWRGTVAPQCGQAGGGVEVYFPEGADHQVGIPYIISES